MDHLTAIPTEFGLNVLSSELKDTATQYALLGATTHNEATENLAVFHQAEIDSSYFDEYGVLTFEVNLPVAQNFEKYMYTINILDEQDNIIISVDTPKTALVTGIGGIVVIKAAVMGAAGEIIFRAHDYITESQMLDLYLPPLILARIVDVTAIIHNMRRTLANTNEQEQAQQIPELWSPPLAVIVAATAIIHNMRRTLN